MRRFLPLFILSCVTVAMAVIVAFVCLYISEEAYTLIDLLETADDENVAQDNIEDCNSIHVEATETEGENQKQEVGVNVGIVTDITNIEGIPLAVIDGAILKEGQTVSSVKIVKINPDYVEFEYEGNNWSQRIKEPPRTQCASTIDSRILPKYPSAEDIVKYASPAIVTICTYDDSGNELKLGSGFFIENGKILTNAHVVEGAYSAEVSSVQDYYFDVTIDKRDDDLDLAVLSVQSVEEPTISLADDTNLVVGQPVLTIGNPLGLERTVSDGLISAIRDWEGVQDIQVTAPISPGSSGGPLLNMRGLVIGVTYAGIEEGQNLNFAIGIETIKRFLQTPDNPEQLKEAGSYIPEKYVHYWIKIIVIGIVALVIGIICVISIKRRLYRLITTCLRRKKYRLQRFHRKKHINRCCLPTRKRGNAGKVYSSSNLQG